MEKSCGSCKKPILEDKGAIRCGNCNHSFHLGCTPIQSAGNISTLGVDRERWTCPECSSKEAPSSFVDEVVTRSALEDVVGRLTQSWQGVSKDVAELRKAVTSLTRQVEDYKATVCRVEDDIGQLQVENSRLQTRNGNLWRTVVRLGDDLSDLQQLRLREVDGQSRDTGNCDLLSPRGIVTLGLSYLTFAGIFYLMASRMLKIARKIMQKEPEQVQLQYLQSNS